MHLSPLGSLRIERSISDVNAKNSLHNLKMVKLMQATRDGRSTLVDFSQLEQAAVRPVDANVV